MIILTPDLWKLLQKRYADDRGWVLLSEIQGKSGYNQRRSDGVALNLYSSRGNTIVGFELKVSRSDWVHELRDPSKAEGGVYGFCDYWYLVVGDLELVKDGELPETWGLLAPQGKTKSSLREYTKAPKLDPKPVDRYLTSVLLRRSVKDVDRQVQKATTKGFESGLERGGEDAQVDLQELQKRLTKLEDKCQEFLGASGINIANSHLPGDWYKKRNMQDVGRLLKFLLEEGPGDVIETVRNMRDRLDKESTKLNKTLYHLQSMIPMFDGKQLPLIPSPKDDEDDEDVEDGFL